MTTAPQRRSILAFLARHRATFVMAVVVALASSGTAAAVSYLVLGTTNTAGATTTLKSGVNAAVLQLTNTNTIGGTSARGLGITVPAGRAPLTVNAGAGKATNLNADKLDGLDQSAFLRSTGKAVNADQLDGLDQSAFARGTNVTILANRLVLDNGETGVVLLALPGLGALKGSCSADVASTSINWLNTTSGNIDAWTNSDSAAGARFRANVALPGWDYVVARWSPGSPDTQTGDTLLLGQGNDPGARRTATVIVGAYRSVAGAPCGLQATATLWSTP